jgi:hypothetical protein
MRRHLPQWLKPLRNRALQCSPKGLLHPFGGRRHPVVALFKRSTLCLLAAICFAVTASARSWNIADFADSITIDDHGSALVTERITCNFEGEYHGIIRRIPIEYPGPKGTNFTLYMKILSVTDGDGNKLKYDLTNAGDMRQLKIYIPGATDTKKEVDIAYEVSNAIRHFEDFDEFYWNVTGNDWPVPIDHASASVYFPPSARNAGLRAQAFTGPYGSTEHQASATINDSDIPAHGALAAFETTNPLEMRGGLTIDVYIPKGVLREPSELTRLGWFLGSNPIVFLPPFAFVVMFSLWYWKGKDPDPGMSVAPMYSPPENISPAEAGTLLGDSVHPRDITASLVDLAVRGYIKIEETTQKVLVFSSKDYVFHLLKGRAQWDPLPEHEQDILEQMFPVAEVDTTCALSSLKNRFYMAIPQIKNDVMTALKQKGMYGLDPDSAHFYGIVGAVIIAAPFILLQFAGIANFALSGWLLWASIIVAAFIAFAFIRVMPAKSLRGAKTTVGIKGFQEFMSRVDGDRLRTMPGDTFEKFLPYAMALGVEEHWAKAFQGIIQNPPTWYVGPGYGTYGMFNPVLFTHDVRTMSNVAASTFVSAPRSSSSGSGFGGGGFSGGGFSGGGFGGGGGDAF